MYKLIASMTTPIVWVLSLILLGLILRWRPQRKRLYFLGQILIICAGFVLYVFSIPAISNQLIYSLESQYPKSDIEALSNLDLIVVLGAGYHPSGGLRENAEPSGYAYSRVFGGVKAFKNSGAGMLAFCEGWRDKANESGAEVMKAYAMELGISEDKIITEDRSQNTMENCMELKRLVASEKKIHIGLATSAWHMPRSLQVFRQVFSEDKIVPIPAGYLYTAEENFLKNITPSARDLQLSTEAIHEWIGMLWYKIRYFSSQ